MSVVLPDWCELVRGDGSVLLVAPHGGRRPPVDPAAPPANLKVNDVYTAELTRELAAQLGATAVINHSCDRNRFDLNRLSQVRRYAPWFLTLLRDEIAAILSQHECAEILFVHGWNVGQSKCDFGIGARETEDGVVTPDGAALTVSPSYLDHRLAPLRAALEGYGIATFIGVRYPASHPNNLLQVFSAREDDGRHLREEGQFAGWASEGRLQAVQLELGVPVRWPGVWRERFVEAMAAQFGVPGLRARSGADPSSTKKAAVRKSESNSGDRPRATSLQFYDPVADVGLLAGVGPISKGVSAARLLLFLGGQRVALFTGEQAPPKELCVEPLRFEGQGESTTLSFAGPILHLDDGATYLDLEAAFAASTLCEAAVELRFTRVGAESTGAEFGHIEGWIDLGGHRRPISTGAYVNAAAPRASQRFGYLRLAADFGGDHGILAHLGDDGEAQVVEFRPHGVHGRQNIPLSAASAGSLPLELPLMNGSVLCANPLSRMEILRSLPDGKYVRVTFGTARFHWQQRQGYGVYEYAKRVASSG